LAKQKASEAGFPLRGYFTGTATDLTCFSQDSYDAVLCLGPLYHLTHPDDRSRALREAIRVLKPGGLLAVSFLSSYAHIFDLVSRDPTLILEWDIAALANRCRSSSFEDGDRVFTSSYYIEPFEVSGLMAAFPLEKLALIGAQGLVAQGQGMLIKSGPDVLDRWIQLSIAVAETNGALGSSIHLVYFARKR
jgi:SAM-dependent methyltransferase